MKKLSRKLPCLVGAVSAVILALPDASAEVDPAGATRVVVPSTIQEKTPPAASLRVVVPCPPGSPGDLIAHAMARVLSERLGRQVAVENVAAGAGHSASEEPKQEATSDSAIFLLPGGESGASACGE